MNDKKSTKDTNFIDLRDILGILIKRKWVFIITFIIVLIGGLLFTFLVFPEYYGSTSKIKISIGDIYYFDDLYKYFPAEASELYIFRTDMVESFEVDKLDIISEELKSDFILEEAIKKLNFEIGKSDLRKIIDTYVDRNTKTLIITAYVSSPELAYDINKALLDTYEANKYIETEKVYNSLLQKIDDKLEEIEKEISGLSQEVEEYVIDYNVKFVKELDKLNLDNIKNFSGINFIPPILDNEIKSKYETYNNLDAIKNNLIENEGYFIRLFQVIKEPEISDVRDNSNYIRNSLLSVIAAVVIGIIMVFIFNYFKSTKKVIDLQG